MRKEFKFEKIERGDSKNVINLFFTDRMAYHQGEYEVEIIDVSGDFGEFSKEWFLDRAEKLRSLVPNVSISTDVIVGFPGESDEDFEYTMDVLEKVRFEQMFSFKYSPRPLTKAAEFTNQVDSKVASERLKRLQVRHTEILDEIANAQQDKIMDVYFEEARDSGMIAGRSFTHFLVQVKGDESLVGQTRKVKITNPRRLSLYGELC